MPHDRISAITLCVLDATQNNRQIRTPRESRAKANPTPMAAKIMNLFLLDVAARISISSLLLQGYDVLKILRS